MLMEYNAPLDGDEAVLEMSSEGDDGRMPESQIMDLTSQLREAVEKRDYASLNLLLSNSPLWLYDRPGSLKDFHESLVRVTEDSNDLEFFILKISAAEFSDERASISAETQLLWTNEETWEEVEINSFMHLGFTKNDKGWKISYLGFTPRQSLMQPSLLQTSGTGMESGYFRAPEEFMWQGTYFGTPSAPPAFSNPFQGAASYFASGNFAYQSNEEVMPLVPVYVPEFVLMDVMKKLLKK